VDARSPLSSAGSCGYLIYWTKRRTGRVAYSSEAYSVSRGHVVALCDRRVVSCCPASRRAAGHWPLGSRELVGCLAGVFWRGVSAACLGGVLLR
jgi:hypothetical protein